MTDCAGPRDFCAALSRDAILSIIAAGDICTTNDCMTSWVALRHLGTDTLGGSLGGPSFV